MGVRTRFAPSPTGYMHIGNLRTALYAYLFARRNDGEFILRLEDTDRERLVDEAADIIYRTLHEAGLRYDEGPDIGGPDGPYIQSERRDIYEKYARELVDKGAAYYCFCTKERLAELRAEAEKKGEVFQYDGFCANLSKEEVEAKLAAGEPYVIRQKIPDEGVSEYDDMVYGRVSVPNADMEDGILLKSDGYPTYGLANVIDDHLMGITHVIRGSEYLSSTPKYNLLYEALGWEPPKYAHLPPVMRDRQHKLSKRDGAASYEEFVEQGFLPEAIINYIALLGWAPPGIKEILTLGELARVFNLKDVNKAPAIFDEEKLRWMNAEYIRKLSEREFLERAKPYIAKVVDPDTLNLSLLAEMIQARLETLGEIPDKIAFLAEMPPFDIELYRHKKMKVTPESSYGYLKAARNVLGSLKSFEVTEVHDALMNLVKELGIKNGQLLYPLRIALTNTAVTPGGAVETAALLGKEETLKRLDTSIDELDRALTEMGTDTAELLAGAPGGPKITVATSPAASFASINRRTPGLDSVSEVAQSGVRRVLKEGFGKDVAQKLHPELTSEQLDEIEADMKDTDAPPVADNLTTTTRPAFTAALYKNDEIGVSPESSLGYLKAAYPVLAGLSEWSLVYIEDALWQLIRELGIVDRELYYPLLAAMTNASPESYSSHDAASTAVTIGPEETLERIAFAVHDLGNTLTQDAIGPTEEKEFSGE